MYLIPGAVLWVTFITSLNKLSVLLAWCSQASYGTPLPPVPALCMAYSLSRALSKFQVLPGFLSGGRKQWSPLRSQSSRQSTPDSVLDPVLCVLRNMSFPGSASFAVACSVCVLRTEAARAEGGPDASNQTKLKLRTIEITTTDIRDITRTPAGCQVRVGPWDLIAQRTKVTVIPEQSALAYFGPNLRTLPYL
jgi:hypothetical protein